MEGFGYDEKSTPFNYGSVKDGIVENPSLEDKLKKQYWKTKQTVLQKLKKTEDEFVVAGDADIDAKLEVSEGCTLMYCARVAKKCKSSRLPRSLGTILHTSMLNFLPSYL